jgi:hypothetical protein
VRLHKSQGLLIVLKGLFFLSLLRKHARQLLMNLGRSGPIAYLVLTSLYSLFLKRFLVIDVLVFALLYTLRVIAGHLATGIPFSLWVLSCAFFLFLILAYGKRDQI